MVIVDQIVKKDWGTRHSDLKSSIEWTHGVSPVFATSESEASSRLVDLGPE